MHLTRGMCGVSLLAMLGRDYIRLIQDHFAAENIGRVHLCGILLDFSFGVIPLGMLNLICDRVGSILMDCDYV